METFDAESLAREFRSRVDAFAVSQGAACPGLSAANSPKGSSLLSRSRCLR